MQIESIKDVWKAVCDECLKRQYITEIAYGVWFADIVPIKMENGKFVGSIYSSYKKSIVESNFKNYIELALKDIMGFPIEFELLLSDENGSIISNNPEEKNNDNSHNSFESNFTFENYIVGSSNRFAHAAAMAVADSEVTINQYNPLVIYGNSGVGKTHLLLAVKNHINKKFPSKKVEYIRGEEFTNNMIAALRDGTIEDFKNRYRNADCFLMDDIHFIAGKDSTQEEFFNTFNALYQNNKQIIVTCDRPPKDIKTLEERIRSRFEGGVMADITPPDFETRVGIINTKASLLNLSLDENIVYFIAEHIKMNTRQLEGVVKKLQAYVNLQNKTPTISVVQGFIRDIISDTTPEPIKIDEIIFQVSKTFNVSEKDIISKRKTAAIAFARQVAMYIARETTELSYKAIGESFGKDHATVLYNVQKIEEHLN
ncbi:MAG: chromosomal replication initiator protein DnaA, partial [Acutalibacteraceae bacterium]|nr:chromosomal replication initiator protein DnaA [Acutalibacteraceae bacterium]